MFVTKLIGLLLALSFSMSLAIADTRLPDENTLIKRFESLGLVKADKWKNAEAPDSTAIKSARVGSDVYSIADDSVTVFSLISEKNTDTEAQHVVDVCLKLAEVAMQNVTTETTNKIKGVIQKSALNFNEDSDMVDGYKFTTKSYAFGNTPAVGCMIEGFVTWN
ncbi:hypothetical protein [Yersinia enterocolitica]|uniref:hypothetical protein n=1 Tax=Yersinia enterocolitica TaxID=630 RepID=UPI003D79C43A